MNAEASQDDNQFKISNLYALIALVVSVLITAYSTKFGPIAVLAFYGLWLPFLLLPLLKQKSFILFPIHHHILPFIFAGICIYSVFWSDYVNSTVYTSIQYFTTILCAIIIAKLLPFETFVKGICYGCFAVLVFYFVLAKIGVTGLFGSKNMIGMYAQIGLIACACLLLFSSHSKRAKILFCVIPLLFFVFILIKSHSSTSVLSSLIILAVLGACVILSRASQGLRVTGIIMGLMLMSALAMLIVFFEFDVYGYILDLFGKSRTLTGRTDIWQTGFDVIANRPLLGSGYAAFWIPGQIYAEEIWAEFEITGKSGFHFHNLFIQTCVEIGFVGLIFLVCMMLSFSLRSITLFIKNGLNLYVAMFITCFVLFITRAFTEVDMFFPYTIGTLLFFSLYAYIVAYKPEKPLIYE